MVWGIPEKARETGLRRAVHHGDGEGLSEGKEYPVREPHCCPSELDLQVLEVCSTSKGGVLQSGMSDGLNGQALQSIGDGRILGISHWILREEFWM